MRRMQESKENLLTAWGGAGCGTGTTVNGTDEQMKQSGGHTDSEVRGWSRSHAYKNQRASHAACLTWEGRIKNGQKWTLSIRACPCRLSRAWEVEGLPGSAEAPAVEASDRAGLGTPAHAFCGALCVAHVAALEQVAHGAAGVALVAGHARHAARVSRVSHRALHRRW